MMKAVAGFFVVIACCMQAWSAPIVDTAYAVQIGGINQWISIKGKDSSKPLLLWLHGGPGVSEMGNDAKYSNHLKENFMVVQWDQRESGKTAGLNHSPDLRLEQINQDVHDIIQYLLQQFHRNKLFLVGNSWGGYLALQAASHYPELLAACILVSPNIYGNESEKISLQYVTEEARKRNDKTAMDEIATIKVPFEQPMDAWLLRKWLFTFHGENVSRALPPEDFFLDFVKPWFPAIIQYEAYNPFVEVREIDCPIYFLLGKTDYITHSEIAQRFYDQLKAKTKNIYWFDAGHMIPREKPAQMQKVIISQITTSVSSK